MTVAASSIFDALESNGICPLIRHEITSAGFSKFRSSLRSIIINLSQSDEHDAHKLLYHIRGILYEWLTAPIPFTYLSDSLKLLGDPISFENRWGHDVRRFYDEAIDSAAFLKERQNPIRRELLNIIREAVSTNKTYKIYCQKWTIENYESLHVEGNIPLCQRSTFLTSVKDYRETEPFDILIKVGPFWSRGYASAPDAILTAPRFSSISQVVWFGICDEAGFGYDPIADSANIMTRFHRKTIFINDDFSIVQNEDSDEFALFNSIGKSSEKRDANIIHIDDNHGIVYAAHSRIFSYNPLCSERPIKFRKIEELYDGMFLLIPEINGLKLTSDGIQYDRFSQIWKARLIEELKLDKDWVLARLVKKGVDLQSLEFLVENWCKPPSTVIHAPLNKEHFKILVEVLETDDELPTPPQMDGRPWFEQAWDEILKSRGQAIQTGFYQQEMVFDQLASLLNGAFSDLLSKTRDRNYYSYVLGGNKPFAGTVDFFKIKDIEGGFKVPDKVLRDRIELKEAEQWRA